MSRAAILACLVMLAVPPPSSAHPAAQDGNLRAACDAAASVAEHRHQLPAGILGAIGRVESGRTDATGNTAPWPWAIDVDGADAFPPTAEAAVAAVRTLQARGRRNIDVGCFQVNLQQHPEAFATLDTAFDPQINADFAASFLAALRRRLGSWPSAVAAYHSLRPSVGEAYRRRVFARWAGASALAGPMPGPISREAAAADGPVVIAGVRIWSPRAPGSAPIVVRVGAPPESPQVLSP